MNEKKPLKFPSANLPETIKGLTKDQEAAVLALIDAYFNSNSLRLRTGSISGTDGWSLAADGTFTTSKQIISTLATGTAPLVIASTTLCTNLNADKVDGYDLNQAVTTSGTPTFVKLTLSGDTLNITTAKTPASAGAAGTAGDVCRDADYIYVCTATNTWKRVAIATW